MSRWLVVSVGMGLALPPSTPIERATASIFITLAVRRGPISCLSVDGCSNGLTEFRRRNLFEDGAKLERVLVPECAFELTLRCSPAGTGLGRSSLSGLCQRYDAAASIPFGNFELDQIALFERAEKVPQRRPVHDQQPCEILDRTRTDEAQPRQDRVLVRAQSDGREGVVIKLCHAARCLAKRGAITDFRLDGRH
jgi:hypothetical protein